MLANWRSCFPVACVALLMAALASSTPKLAANESEVSQVEKASQQLGQLIKTHDLLSKAKRRILEVDSKTLPLVEESIRELLKEKEQLTKDLEKTVASIGVSSGGPHAQQINRIRIALRQLVGLTPPGPTADIPVFDLLVNKLGVDPVLAAAESNWCECLQGTAHGRRTDGGFVTLDGENFPALQALPPPPIPADNKQMIHTEDDPATPDYDDTGFPRRDDPKVQLGMLLFFDARLSGDNSVACSTCHAPDQGWGLNSAISRGYPGTSHWRNSHTALNSAYMWKLFWDGSAKALEPQAKSANTGLSGNGKTDMMEERLRQCPDYVRMFKEVFGTEIPLLDDAWRAIGAFQRTVIQPDTPFDRYMMGDKSALEADQVRGLELFQGKAGCIKCHNGPILSDQKYYNIGLPQEPSFLEDPIKQITHRFQYFSKGVVEEKYRNGKQDLGLYFVSKREADIGKFRAAPLRYLEYTPPYMHNGTFDTLEEVVEFYNKGGEANWTKYSFGIDNKSKRMKKLNLTEPEKKDLVAFLRSLSGEEIRDLTPWGSAQTPPKLPDPMAFVYRGETYIGNPIPVVNTEANVEDRKVAEKVTWSLVSGPEGVTINPETGRVTWPNAQPPADGKPITITIRSTTAKGATADQTLLLTVYKTEAPALNFLTG
ncbi:MAG: cytochrome c peroxidase, partial [Pirellulaceae bacterium]|nr:cytochrome c peroxidase [Pirellulaceae bacterium]